MGGGNHGGKKSRNGCATDAATAYKQALKLCGDGMYMKALTVSAVMQGHRGSVEAPMIV